MGIIKVTGIQLFAYHGCLDEEAKIGTNYTINILVDVDFSKSEQTDELQDTVDYVEIYQIVKAEMAIRSKLIEHVGRRIKDQLTNRFSHAEHIEVEIIKHKPPMNGNVDQVSVIL